MRNSGIGLAAAVALVLGGMSAGGQSWRRELTLDEEEEQWVARMMRHAHAKRLQTERQRRREQERLAAEEAARIEAARPKSRQELRARERASLKHVSRELPPMKYGRVIPKEKSSSLERMLAKSKRRGKSV